MPTSLTGSPIAIMDRINRVLDPIWTSCGVAYKWHFDLLQG